MAKQGKGKEEDKRRETAEELIEKQKDSKISRSEHGELEKDARYS